MEAAKRWETEAIREARDRRRGRPVVSQSRINDAPDGEWATLREAADATGIPINTLRKWCRRETVNSYLESDGQLTLRIVEMSSVRHHAAELGRSLVPLAEISPPSHADGVRDEAPETMIVPVDAWNKMLNQLGNLHEAGQQLAEARERAAKAETEAKFLRERLAELRAAPVAPLEDSADPTLVPPIEERGDAEERSDDAVGPPAVETTSFFRYVVRGWRGRKR